MAAEGKIVVQQRPQRTVVAVDKQVRSGCCQKVMTHGGHPVGFEAYRKYLIPLNSNS